MIDSRFPIDPPVTDKDEQGGAGAIDPELSAQTIEDAVLVAIAEQVRNGTLGLHDAVEHLVGRAAAAVEGALSPAQSAELRDLLRNAVVTDPLLAALVHELSGRA